MGLRLWDGVDTWTTGEVYQWDGTELRPGVLREYPWEGVQPPTTAETLDGGTPATSSWTDTIDGGAPATSFTTLPEFDGGPPA
jgi:hypothetical protein